MLSADWTPTPPGLCTLTEAARRVGCDPTVLEDLAGAYDLGAGRHVFWSSDGERVPLVDIAQLEGWA